MKVRLQRLLAGAGIASRRASEQVILAGRVTVNGQPVRLLGSKVDPDTDHVAVDGQPIRQKKLLYVAVNKPRACICSRTDAAQRRRVLDLIPKEWSNLYPVGRLDYETEGLLFLTNDGEFCLRLTHPRYQVGKVYVATVEGRIDPSVLNRFLKGVHDRGELLQAKAARLLSSSNSQSVVRLELTEGRNREVRRLFESQNLVVTRLQRVQIGPIKLGDLPGGKWRVLTPPEIRSLLQAATPAPRRAPDLASIDRIRDKTSTSRKL